MAFCQNCGSAVEGNFCAKCGAAVGLGSSPGTGGGSQPAGASSSGLSDNLAGALCYIPLIGALIFLLMAPYNTNKAIRFHAFQALFVLGVIIVLEILISQVLMAWYLLPVVRLGSIALWIYMGFKTYSGAKIVLPVVGPIAEKQA